MVEAPGVAISFLAGLAAFASPCVYPLLPAYVGYFGGTAAAAEKRGFRGRTFRNAVLFVAGFTVIFVLLGLASSAVGHALAIHRLVLTRVGGALLLLFGVMLLGVLPLPALYRQFSIARRPDPAHPAGAFLVGLTFGFAWTPCIGPILGTILLLAAGTASAVGGAFLLFVYALGIAVPFLALSLFLDRLAGFLQRTRRFMVLLQRTSGVLLLVVGILMVSGRYGLLTGWLLRYLPQPAL